MTDAVFYLKKAVNCADNDDYDIELAKTLSKVSQYDQSNLIYLKLLAHGKKQAKCFFGLSQNLYYQSNLENSLYYLNLYMEKYSSFDSIDEDEYIEIIEETDMFEGYSLVYPYEKQDMSNIINQARAYMKSGLFEKAMTILKKIPKGNFDYIFALNNLALCCFFLNDFSGTKKYSDKVLQIDKNNIFALCNLAAMYNYIEDNKNVKKYLNRILNIKTNDISDLFKIATTLCELKKHNIALKYLKIILNNKPYDVNIMFLTAIAYYNNKNIKEAIDVFLQLNKLNEKDYAVKYYLELIRDTVKEKDIEKGFFQPLEYICQVPYGEMLTRIKKLRKITIADINQNINDEDFFELCDWCYSLSDYRLQKKITEKLATINNQKIELFLREKLIDPVIPNAIKSIIIEKFILKKIMPPYNVSIDYKVVKLTPKIKSIGKSVFYKAYAKAYAVLMMLLPINKQDSIYTAYEKLVNKANAGDFKDKNALSAIIAFGSDIKNLPKEKNNIYILFDADGKIIRKYLMQLDKNNL